MMVADFASERTFHFFSLILSSDWKRTFFKFELGVIFCQTFIAIFSPNLSLKYNWNFLLLARSDFTLRLIFQVQFVSNNVGWDRISTLPDWFNFAKILWRFSPRKILYHLTTVTRNPDRHFQLINQNHGSLKILQFVFLTKPLPHRTQNTRGHSWKFVQKVCKVKFFHSLWILKN